MRAHLPVPRAAAAAASERGSAYLFALLALLVLTVIGLSLVVITQTEAQIGGAEKSANRVLYGADSGLRMQMIAHAGGSRLWEVDLDEQRAADDTLREVVSMSVFYPIHTGPCNICSVNLGSDRFWAINYVTNARAERVDQTNESTANKRLSQMFYKQPEQERRIDLSIRLFDATLDSEDPNVAGLELLEY
jgi:hypothetical protein